jgi:hypothetical protein
MQRKADGHTNLHIYELIDRQTDREINWETDNTSRLISRQTDMKNIKMNR